MYQLPKILFICILLLSPVHMVSAGEISQNYYGLGVFAYEEGNYTEARTLLLKAVAMDGENARAYYYLGQACKKLSQPEEAERYLKRAFAVDPLIPGLKYALGLLFYEKNNFEDALQKFQEVAAQDPADVLAIYHTGLCQYKLERYEAAAESLLKAAQMSPTIEANGYYYAGVCNFYVDRLDEASAQFVHVIEVADTPDVKENAALWLKAVKNKTESQKPYQLYVKAGYQYDDNVVLAPGDLDIISDESDSTLLVYFSGKYDVIHLQRFDGGLGYSHYQTRYQDLEEYNLTGSIGNIYADWQCSDAVSIGVNYHPAYYWVDSESYLMQHQIAPYVSWMIDSLKVADISYRYYRHNYFQENSRDGHSNELTLNYSHGFSGIDGYFFCGAGIEIYSAEEEDEDYDEVTTLLGCSLDVLENTNLTVYGNYFDKNYDHRDLVYNVKREDSRYFLFVSLSQTVWRPWLSLSAEYTFTKNNSSISDFDYDRNAVLLSVSVKL